MNKISQLRVSREFEGPKCSKVLLSWIKILEIYISIIIAKLWQRKISARLAWILGNIMFPVNYRFNVPFGANNPFLKKVVDPHKMISSGREREAERKRARNHLDRLMMMKEEQISLIVIRGCYHIPRNMSCCFNGLDQSSGNKRNLWVRLLYNGYQ